MNEHEKVLQVEVAPDHLHQIIKLVNNLRKFNQKQKHLLVLQIHLLSQNNHKQNGIHHVEFHQIIKVKNQLLKMIIMIKVNSIIIFI